MILDKVKIIDVNELNKPLSCYNFLFLFFWRLSFMKKIVLLDFHCLNCF